MVKLQLVRTPCLNKKISLVLPLHPTEAKFVLGSLVESLTKATMDAAAVNLLPELVPKQFWKQMFPPLVVRRRVCGAPGQGMMRDGTPCVLRGPGCVGKELSGNLAAKGDSWQVNEAR